MRHSLLRGRKKEPPPLPPLHCSGSKSSVLLKVSWWGEYEPCDWVRGVDLVDLEVVSVPARIDDPPAVGSVVGRGVGQIAAGGFAGRASGSGSAGGIIGDLVVSLRPGRTPFVGLKWWIGVDYVDRASASGTPPPVAGVQAIREFVIAVLRHV